MAVIFSLRESRNEKNAKIAKSKLITNKLNTFYLTEMKTKIDLRRAPVGIHEKEGREKKLMPEKKLKNQKRALFEELEEDEELDDLFSFKERESIEDYYDDDIEDEDY